ncbi:MAG: DUF4876 domain-containing protein [Bacteroidales bacterium]|nr:DUF4876 domain-containing protein [Bacteroidales bacterium]
MMKKISLILLFVALMSVSCKKLNDYKTYEVTVKVVFPESGASAPSEGITVNLTSVSSGTEYTAETDAGGAAKFEVPVGVFRASASTSNLDNGIKKLYNGNVSNIIVSSKEQETSDYSIDFTESQVSQIVISELYIGGCPKDNASGSYYYDKYMKLYNNSDDVANLTNLCIGMAMPYNANSTNKYIIDGKLSYESEGWIPAGQGFFYIPSLTIEPWKSVVIAFNNANDNTITYSKSVDLSDASYYVTYDPSVYTNTVLHPAPSANIPVSHYFSAYAYGAGNAWPLSFTSPALFVFSTKNSTPAAFAADPNNLSYYGGSTTQVCKKVPVDWVYDGVEIFRQGYSTNKNRLTSAVDAGDILFKAKLGYSVYRNVDKDATEAIVSNKGKLVYSYAYGTGDITDGSTDPSGIDAEASIANGAKIVYMDTNNSSSDFHQRLQASLRDGK